MGPRPLDAFHFASALTLGPEALPTRYRLATQTALTAARFSGADLCGYTRYDVLAWNRPYRLRWPRFIERRELNLLLEVFLVPPCCNTMEYWDTELPALVGTAYAWSHLTDRNGVVWAVTLSVRARRT
ncbi:hypothetical protein [Streptomyces sp. MMG1121]|uniref:hypothetical protein n=1 Tax=Streptomyces sp. MMG1121 TaxID=1415544 RepID=UPI00131E0019|nr:hypothetical protein [Streptomyces sp. MMG1121]